jgi:BREX protein BrxB
VLSLKERIELLERDLRADPPAFSMSRDLPFAIFRYDPQHPGEDEWRMRREIIHLATRVENATGKRVHQLPLSKLFWRSIEESEGIDALVELERERGFLSAEEQINLYLSDPQWRPLVDLLAEDTREMDPGKEMLFLTRAAVFAPAAYRVSSLLEQVMGKVRVPSVLFYPGTWTGSLNFLGLRSDEEPLGSYRVKIYGRES